MRKEKFNDLLLKIKSGDKAAFTVLYREYYPKMFSAAKYITNNREDAEDAVHQAFIKFWKYVVESERPYLEYPNAYIFTITKNCAIDVIQSNRVYRSCELSETLAVDDNYEERAIADIDLKMAIKELKEPEQTVALQFFLFDMKIKEIAEGLGEPVGTVKWRISEIKKFLKKFLK